MHQTLIALVIFKTGWWYVRMLFVYFQRCYLLGDKSDRCPCLLLESRWRDLLTYAHRSRWSISHQRPLAIALCSGLLWSLWTSWSLAVSARLQCLASSCCEAGLSFSSPACFRSGQVLVEISSIYVATYWNFPECRNGYGGSSDSPVLWI